MKHLVFNLVLIAVTATLLPACSDSGAPFASPSASLPEEPFSIGKPDRYRDPGVYKRFARSHGVYIVSNGRFVVALSALCPTGGPGDWPSAGDGVRYDELTGKFRCPRDGATFSRDGLRLDDRRAIDGLRRCRLELEDGELVVYTRTRYSHVHNQWSQPYSMHQLQAEEPEALADATP